MPVIYRTLAAVALVILLTNAPMEAGDLCPSAVEKENLSYSWRMHGILGWIIGLRFPTSGVGELNTSSDAQSHAISSDLTIRSSRGDDGFYTYQSRMDESGERTLVSYHGYSWGNKERHERTLFDYVKRLARIRKETPEKVESKVKPLPPGTMQDVLTGIFYLRQNAHNITAPYPSEIYSDGKIYPVVFRPSGTAVMKLRGEETPVRAFLITAAENGGKRWPGGVKVWLSDDSRRLPLRIELQRSFASLQLDLREFESCGLRVGP